jgi:hypothetical protein
MAMFLDTGGYVLEHLQDTMVFIANYGGVPVMIWLVE